MLKRGCLLSLAALWLVPVPARALSITVTAPPTVSVGSSFYVEIQVLGSPELGNYAAPSVRAFDLDLAFDASKLTYTATTFAGFLGMPISQAIVSASAAAGILDLKEVSLLSSGALDALQPQDFLLATLTFEATAAGPVTLELTQKDLADVAGSRFVVAGPSAASLEIVPEPGTALLLAGGLLALAARRPVTDPNRSASTI